MSDEVRTRPLGTLLRVPPGEVGAAADVAVLGLPFDTGRHPDRIGARNGPDHVRRHSLLVADQAADYGIAPLEALRIADCGDLDLVPGEIDAAFARIEAAVAAVLAAGAIPLTRGGDGSVTLPHLRAVAKAHPGLAVLHVDAHTDAYDGYVPQPYNNANPFVHAVTEGLIDVAASSHVGVRATAVDGAPGALARAAELGYTLISVDEIGARGAPAVAGQLRAAIGERPLYVCWDLDSFDPSVAPGVVTPAWGGLTVREGLALARGLAGLDIVAIDVNALSPPHDAGGQTGSLAAQVIVELLLVIARRRASLSSAQFPY
jgi:agmatinase